MRNFVGLVAARAGKGEGNIRGGLGPFIAATGKVLMAGINGN
jgi:hypothetical protein